MTGTSQEEAQGEVLLLWQQGPVLGNERMLLHTLHKFLSLFSIKVKAENILQLFVSYFMYIYCKQTLFSMSIFPDGLVIERFVGIKNVVIKSIP